MSVAGAAAMGLIASASLAGCAGRGEEPSASSSSSSSGAASSSSSPSSASSSAASAAAVATTGNGTSAVVCFSATGTTMAEAEKIAEQLGVSVDEIVPAEPYTAADLNYSVDDCRANIESRDSASRPAIASARTDLSGVDTVYIGYPIWWGDAAPIMRTYIESVDLEGKKVVPFCTSGGSGIASSVTTLESLANGGDWTSGLRLTGSDAQVEQLLAQ